MSAYRAVTRRRGGSGSRARRPGVFETLEQRQLLATVWHYDFGPAGSPAATGYTAAGAAAYSAAAGFGWTAGQVDTRDRGPLPGTSALTEGFALTGSGSFAVALPNGTYSVAVTLGDASYAHGPVGVSLQGQQVDSVATAADQFATRTYTAAVSNGQLVLGLRNLGVNSADVACIDALAITLPVSPPPPPPPPPSQLTPGPHVISATPIGDVAGPVSQITLTFNEPIQGGSFTLADVDSLIGPAGSIAPTAVNMVDSTHYTVIFPAQSSKGTYALTVGPNILDPSGNAMDQNQDGVNGKFPQDEFTTSFVLSSTTVPKTGVVSVVAENIGSSSLTNSPVRFAEVFADGDIPAGSRLLLSLPDGTSVPYTAARVNTWPDGSLRTADILAELPNGASGTTTITPGNTLPLTFTAQPGTFNNALPAGKTVANIVSQIVSGTAPIGVELDGLTNSAGKTVGSGTWVADSATAFGLTGTAGGYTCVATGPTVADFEARMMLRDPNNGNAQNANLWAEFYITAFLNPSTGAVQQLSWRTWLDQGNMAAVNDSFQAKVKLTLGGNTIRSWGFASDGRDMAFAPSAVNTANSQITLPGNGFVNGEVVQFSSTGTLPGGLLPNTNYWVRQVGANAIQVYDNQLSAGVNGSALTLTSQGTDTLRITAFVQILPFQFEALAGVTGNYDWSAGQSTSLIANPAPFIIHDSAYYELTGMAPPLDLAVSMVASPGPQHWAPGTNGAFDTHYGDTGARNDIGSVWDEWAAESFVNPADYAGYAQTALVQALAMGDDPINFVNPTTFQIPVLNQGSYAGLGAAMSNSYYFNSGLHSADIPTPLGTRNEYTQDDGTHSSFVTYAVYLFNGGQDLLDLINSQANYLLLNKTPDSGYITSRNLTYDGRTYYSYMPSSEPRQDGWRLNALVNALTVNPDGSPQRAYFGDLFRDTVDLSSYMINTLGDASWRAAGGWDFGELQQAGAGVPVYSNVEGETDFMQAYIAMSFSFAYVRTRDAVMRQVATQEATYFINKWINFPDKAYNDSYITMVKDGPGSAYTGYQPWSSWGILDGGSQPLSPSGPGGLNFAADGTVTLQSNGSGVAQIPLQDGDRVYLTTTAQSGLEANAFAAPPPQLKAFTWYYVRHASADGLTFDLATTNSDATIVKSYTPTDHIAFYSDVENRTTNISTTIYRHNGAVGMANGGFLTLNRAACGYLYLAGLMDISGFNSADAFFRQETAAGAGPAGFATAIFQSVNTSIRYAGINPGYNAPPAAAPSSPSSPTSTSSGSTSTTSGATSSSPVAGSPSSGAAGSSNISTPVLAAPTSPGLWQYDFGPTGSPAATGYTAAGAAAYSAAAGFGWTAGQVDTRDRGPLPGTSALTEGFALTGSGSFAVALPNGTYSVAVTLGDASYAHGPVGVSLQGQQVDSIATAAGQFTSRTYTATVSDGRLVLGLKNLGANTADVACLDALTIAAASGGDSGSVSAAPTEAVSTPLDLLIAAPPPPVAWKSLSGASDNATDAAIESLVTGSAGNIPHA